MKIEFLRSFILLTETESFSKLASKQGISQSTLSHRISQLEEEFGDIKLIDRTTRKFDLTEEGKVFLGYAKKIIDLYDTSKKDLAKYSDKIIENIIITASTLPGSHILPKYIARFRGDYPNANFKIIINNSKQSLKNLTENQADFAGIGSFMGYKEDNFDKIQIGEENLKFVCSPKNDIIKNGVSITFKELKRLPFINREKGSGTRNIFEQNFPEHDKLESRLEMDDNDSIISAISDSNYFSVLSEIIAKKAVDAGLIKFIEVQEYPIIAKRDIYFIKPKDKELSNLKKKFWETLIKEF